MRTRGSLGWNTIGGGGTIRVGSASSSRRYSCSTNARSLPRFARIMASRRFSLPPSPCRRYSATSSSRGVGGSPCGATGPSTRSSWAFSPRLRCRAGSRALRSSVAARFLDDEELRDRFSLFVEVRVRVGVCARVCVRWADKSHVVREEGPGEVLERRTLTRA
jgi:hypothetical protein